MSADEAVRILAIATNPETGASTRFRVLQWERHLARAGFSLSLDAFFSTAGAEALYRPRRRLAKVTHLLAGAARRAVTFGRAARTADMLFIHREPFPLGRRLFLRAIERFPGPVIYDYDDAMFLPQRMGRGWLSRLEDLETPSEMMRISDVVLAGNEFLADYARRYAKRVVLLPTCIDTDRFLPAAQPEHSSAPLVIGWIGSHSTAKYLRSLAPVLESVARRIPFHLYVVGSREPLALRGVDVEQVPWSLAREVEDFVRCDIGIYPLWDDAWAQGKCGFKAIQFMACGIPVVAAAVGANRDIIQDRVNGYLASTEQEWVERLTSLLGDAELRQRFGSAGRETIERGYSLSAHAPTLIGVLRESWARYRGQGTAEMPAPNAPESAPATAEVAG